MKYYITPIAKLARYNIKIIFGNKFMYFILSAVGFYILTVGLNLISDSEITMATGYSMLLVPSIYCSSIRPVSVYRTTRMPKS